MYINLANIDFGGEGGGKAVLQETTIESLLTETTKVVTPPEGVDGFNKVTVTHAPVETLTEATITSNGETTITPSAGFDATFGVKVVTNVSTGKLKVKDGWSFAYTDDTTGLLEKIDTSEVTSGRNYNGIGMFESCRATDYSSLDLSNVRDASHMFAYPKYDTYKETLIVPLQKLTNCVQFNGICAYPGNNGGLSGMIYFPNSNTYDYIYLQSALSDNYNIVQVFLNYPNAELDMKNFLSMSSYNETSHLSAFLGIQNMQVGKLKNIDDAFRGCTKMMLLTADTGYFDASELSHDGSGPVSPFFKCISLTTLSGFRGLNLDFDLSPCISLSHDSLMNVINEAADVTSSPKTLTLGATNLAKLTEEEKAIATSKGWTLA